MSQSKAVRMGRDEGFIRVTASHREAAGADFLNHRWARIHMDNHIFNFKSVFHLWKSVAEKSSIIEFDLPQLKKRLCSPVARHNRNYYSLLTWQ